MCWIFYTKFFDVCFGEIQKVLKIECFDYLFFLFYFFRGSPTSTPSNLSKLVLYCFKSKAVSHWITSMWGFKAAGGGILFLVKVSMDGNLKLHMIPGTNAYVISFMSVRSRFEIFWISYKKIKKARFWVYWYTTCDNFDLGVKTLTSYPTQAFICCYLDFLSEVTIDYDKMHRIKIETRLIIF